MDAEPKNVLEDHDAPADESRSESELETSDADPSAEDVEQPGLAKARREAASYRRKQCRGRGRPPWGDAVSVG